MNGELGREAAWTCKNCGEKNPINSTFCKGCGEYK